MVECRVVRFIVVVGRVDQGRRETAEIVDGRLHGPFVSVQTVHGGRVVGRLQMIGHRFAGTVQRRHYRGARTAAAAAVELGCIPVENPFVITI